MVLAYEELTEHERAVWVAIGTGALVELPLGAPASDDPATGESWGADRQVRAQLLYELLTGGNGPKDARSRALRMAGARITGTLDLEAAIIVCPLSLRRYFFDEPIKLREAQAPTMRLPDCHAPGLDGELFQTSGNLELDRFAALGTVKTNGRPHRRAARSPWRDPHQPRRTCAPRRRAHC